jgi:Fe2+ or Zn2+ uptake regulation protein
MSDFSLFSEFFAYKQNIKLLTVYKQLCYFKKKGSVKNLGSHLIHRRVSSYGIKN